MTGRSRMNRARLRTGVVLVVIGLVAFACARAQERKAAPSVSPESAAAPSAATGEEPASGSVVQDSVVAVATAEPLDPFHGISGDLSVGFAGDDRLLAEALANDVMVPAFDVACLRGDDALRSPDEVDARFQSLADAQKVSVGRVRFVRLERDPSRAGRGQPRLCRPVAEDAELYAPLFRERESAATWLVEREHSDVKEAVKRLLQRAQKAGAVSAGPPRAVVVRGKVVAVALPILSPS